MDDQNHPVDEGQLLRENLFQGDLLQLPAPEGGVPDLLPEWFNGELPVLVYPPLSERGVQDGDNINLEVSPYHIYYGALRELAESADEERSDMLRRLVLEWNPNAALEVCQLGRTQIEEDVENALLHYELALEIDENLYEAAQDGGMCQYALATLTAGEDREERLDAAAELFERAMELKPDSGLTRWSLARVVHDQGDPDEAEASLRRFLDEYPDGAERDMVEEALVQGFSTPELQPDEEVEAGEEQQIFAEAQALAFGENPARAVELLEPLAEAYPDAGEIWFVLGAAHRRAGDGPEAERCLRRAARLASGEPFVWWELAQAYEDAEHWTAVENAIRKAVELDPENAGYLLVLGRSLLRQGKDDEAAEVLEKAHELVPDDPDIQAALDELPPLEEEEGS